MGLRPIRSSGCGWGPGPDYREITVDAGLVENLTVLCLTTKDTAALSRAGSLTYAELRMVLVSLSAPYRTFVALLSDWAQKKSNTCDIRDIIYICQFHQAPLRKSRIMHVMAISCTNKPKELMPGNIIIGGLLLHTNLNVSIRMGIINQCPKADPEICQHRISFIFFFFPKFHFFVQTLVSAVVPIPRDPVLQILLKLYFMVDSQESLLLLIRNTH